MLVADFDPIYMTLQEVVRQINAYPRTSTRPRKVAITITGGGARGIYEAGVLEAILQEFNNTSSSPIRPDIITGASAGAIIASSLFLDLLYNSPTSSASIYSSNQSGTWREISDGNNGSTRIAGNRAWILKFATGSKPLPIIDDIRKIIKDLGKSKDDVVVDFKTFQSELKKLMDAIHSFDFDTAVLNLNNTENTLESTFTTLRGDANAIRNKAKTLEASGFTDVVEMASLIRSVIKFIGDLLVAIGNVAGALWKDFVDILSTFVNDVDNYLKTVFSSIGDTLSSFGQLVWDGTRFAGNVLLLVAAIDRAVVVLLAILPFIDIFLVLGGMELQLSDHIIDNYLLFNIINSYKNRSFSSSGRRPPPDFHTRSVVIDDWISRTINGEKLPELCLTGTDLTDGASRSVVFTVADSNTLIELDSRSIWAVDLTLRTRRSENIFWPIFGPDEREPPDPLVKATLTSASLPMVFKPVTWDINRNRDGTMDNYRHIFTDGGVLNNSPLDIAIYAGATHVISVELSPLMQDIVSNDSKHYSLVNIYSTSFDAARQGSLTNTINQLVADNSKRSDQDKIQIYRIAPTIPTTKANNKLSVDTIDFDGAYDDDHNLIMSLYDWFMQGYIDAIGSKNLSSSKVFQDYQNAPLSRGDKKNALTNINNKFWRASIKAWPLNPPS